MEVQIGIYIVVGFIIFVLYFTDEHTGIIGFLMGRDKENDWRRMSVGVALFIALSWPAWMLLALFLIILRLFSFIFKRE